MSEDKDKPLRGITVCLVSDLFRDEYHFRCQAILRMAGASITSDLHQQYGEGKSVVVVVPTPAHAWVPLRISSFLLGFDELSANFKSLPAEMLIATDDWVDACLARKALLPVQLGLAAVLPEGSVGSDGQFTGDDESSKSEKRCRLRIAVRPLDAPAHIRITSEARLFEWSKTKGMTQFIAHLHSLEDPELVGRNLETMCYEYRLHIEKISDYRSRSPYGLDSRDVLRRIIRTGVPRMEGTGQICGTPLQA